jgi:hypothetical protein
MRRTATHRIILNHRFKSISTDGGGADAQQYAGHECDQGCESDASEQHTTTKKNKATKEGRVGVPERESHPSSFLSAPPAETMVDANILIGIVVGGACIVVAGMLLLCWCCGQRKKSRVKVSANNSVSLAIISPSDTDSPSHASPKPVARKPKPVRCDRACPRILPR